MSAVAYDGNLKVFSCDDEEWVIATDPADAGDVYKNHAGDTIQNQTGDDGLTWEELPPEKTFKLDNGSGVVAKTCAEWAREHGRGYFASANY